jgi:Bacteriophage T4-like portal protein (Gp20)
MAGWKKYFHIHKSPLNADAKRDSSSHGNNVHSSKFSSYMNEVYTGTPNRVDRYAQYDQMDASPEINAALDTIAEFCTQFDPKTDTPFDIHYNGTPTDTEIKVIKKTLKQWCRINEFDKRLFRILRSTIKYGDQFFIRDPETFEWIWLDPTQLTKVIINETKGKKPEQFIVKNLGLDMLNKTATDIIRHDTQYMSMNSVPGVSGNPASMTSSGMRNFGSSTAATNEFGVDAAHVVHFSMTEGMDLNWPFGTSILESVFKVFKQKELLEDAIIIYRIQRAPERRIFYIDVGNMPSHMAMSYVERVKNEIHQRRIPSRTGGGATVMDASYSPMAMLDDFFFAQSADGRGSKVETLPGGENLGQIDDLKFFTNKMMRALRIPSSYMPTGPDDGTASYNDGKVGTAYIQEFRFNKYCQRIQSLVAPIFDQEFKLFMKYKGLEIDASTFDLRFVAPQNFAAYREIELNSSRVSIFSQMADVPFMSKRFVLKKYLNLDEDEIVENETMWLEENPNAVEQGAQPAGQDGMGGGGLGMNDLGAVGINPPPEEGQEPDMSDVPAAGGEEAPAPEGE